MVIAGTRPGDCPSRTAYDLGLSRLLKNISSYIQCSIMTIVRIFVVYKPFRFFFTLGAAFFLVGTLIIFTDRVKREV